MAAGMVVIVTLVAVATGAGGDRLTAADAGTGTLNRSLSRSAAQLRAEIRVAGLKIPWGLAFLPGGSALISERNTARILRLAPGRAPEVVARLPGVAAAGEGGLLGIAVGPTYAQDRLVYAYITARNDNRIIRFRLGQSGPPRVILAGIPKARIHNGGRIAFGPDGLLYVGTGDAGRGRNAQNRSSLGGKILRINPDGSIPGDNPFPNSPVFSLGHRNVQGLAWDDRGRLWASELGQDTWDEVNLIRSGGNYGWPRVEGRDGSGGFIDPQVVWRTSEASPSGMAFADGALYVAALRGQRLWRIPLNAQGRVGRPEARLRDAYGRLRHVAAAPDGTLWLLTTNRDGHGDPVRGDDRLIRVPLP